MGKDIPLGRIAGIRVGVDITVFLAALYFTVVLALNILPGLARGHSSPAYWVAAACAFVILYLSLLAHEIGHALVARDEGIGVHSMSLNLLGGITRMESSPTTPGAEFRVSVVGPIASAACGVVLLAIYALIPHHGTLRLVAAVFLWTGFVNVFLAVLNMVPASPLDGGKVLSAAIWRATGSQTTAQLWSAGAGVVVGMGLATWGIRGLLSPDARHETAVGALLVGAFIAYNALQQLRSAPLYQAMDGRTVADAMAAGPPSAPGWASVADFLRSSHPRPEHQAYPVVTPDGQVEGLLTASAIRSLPPERWEHLAARDLAYPLDRILVVRSDDSLLTALQRVEGADIPHALVCS
ncbi:MAG: site-2 protease family protein, partial [Acidimicrobiales bacterium]|nr:site-2 protease family protein [Acidimicrobiales bacterium]